MKYETLIVNKEENVCIITLNRPPVNAINYALLDDIEKVLCDIEPDKEIGALIITGGGEKGFSAGMDVKASQILETGKLLQKAHDTYNKIERYPKPIIAAINGFSFGGGFELVMACHFRIMVDSTNAVMGLPEVTIGIMPAWGGTQRLPRLIGKTKAIEMLLLGTRIGAAEALEMKLITKISKADTLLEDAKELAKNLSSKAPLTIKAILDAVNKGLDTTLEEGLKLEQIIAHELGKTRDAKEGLAAFVEKRKPVYKGE